jgi:hypothetical protein
MIPPLYVRTTPCYRINSRREIRMDVQSNHLGHVFWGRGRFVSIFTHTMSHICLCFWHASGNSHYVTVNCSNYAYYLYGNIMRVTAI